jgi:two-component system, LytTR family, sensor kinase
MDLLRRHSGSRQWIWIASVWSAFGLFDAMQTVLMMHAEGMHHAWVTLFLTTMFSWLPWALSTKRVLRLERRFPPVGWTPISTWVVHISACATIGLIYGAWSSFLEVLFNPYANASHADPFVHLTLHKFYNGTLSFVVLYAAILTVGYLLDSSERLTLQRTEAARLGEQLSKAQLNALRQQIEPHFLFNTLNAASGLVREARSDEAVRMIVALSDFLRRTLEDSSRQEVRLSEEIEFAQKYLEIQKVRFADRLHFSIDVPKELYSAQVPSLILQPMIENAVIHGIAKRTHGGMIALKASNSNGRLTLTVANDGPSLPADWDITRAGIGVSNVRLRLQTRYRDAAELSIRNQASGGVVATVSLPFVPAQVNEGAL